MYIDLLLFVHWRCRMGKANYDLPDDKIAEVVEKAGAASKREAIIIALEEYLKRKKIEKLIEHYGQIPLKWTRSSLRKYRV